MKIYKSLTRKVKLVCDHSEDYKNFKKVKIASSEDAFNYVKRFYDESIEIYESFYVLLLNNANNTIGYALIGNGGMTSCIVDIPIVAKFAIDSLAKNVILVHNHPSGNLNPSANDENLTRKIKSALDLFTINVVDHLIISNDEKYFSFADDGRL